MIESEASVKGRVVAEMLSHFTNDLKIGKKIKSGELRKRMIEPVSYTHLTLPTTPYV